MSWRIFAENVGATSEGRNLVIDIPESSVLRLRALEFQSYIGMDRVTLNEVAREKGTGVTNGGLHTN